MMCIDDPDDNAACGTAQLDPVQVTPAPLTLDSSLLEAFKQELKK